MRRPVTVQQGRRGHRKYSPPVPRAIGTRRFCGAQVDHMPGPAASQCSRNPPQTLFLYLWDRVPTSSKDLEWGSSYPCPVHMKEVERADARHRTQTAIFAAWLPALAQDRIPCPIRLLALHLMSSCLPPVQSLFSTLKPADDCGLNSRHHLALVKSKRRIPCLAMPATAAPLQQPVHRESPTPCSHCLSPGAALRRPMSRRAAPSRAADD